MTRFTMVSLFFLGVSIASVCSFLANYLLISAVFLILQVLLMLYLMLSLINEPEDPHF